MRAISEFLDRQEMEPVRAARGELSPTVPGDTPPSSGRQLIDSGDLLWRIEVRRSLEPIQHMLAEVDGGRPRVETQFDLESLAAQLPVDGGVAAFDPLTLRLAADALSSRGLEVRAGGQLAGPAPTGLAELATIEFNTDQGKPGEVTVTIDTGCLRWRLGNDGEAERDEFADYSGTLRRGVLLGPLPVLQREGAALSQAPMAKADGPAVTIWFAELPEPLGGFDGFDLLRLARTQMDAWHLSSAGELTQTIAVVPALRFDYQATDVGGVDVADWPGTEVRQRFAVALDETGARVIAETSTRAGALPAAPKPFYEFGSRGPVLMWFTEPSSGPDQLPFTILYTTADSWLAPDADIDLEEVELPSWAE